MQATPPPGSSGGGGDDVNNEGEDEDDGGGRGSLGSTAAVGIVVGVLVLLVALTVGRHRYHARRATKAGRSVSDDPDVFKVEHEHAQDGEALESGGVPHTVPSTYAYVGAVVNQAYEPADATTQYTNPTPRGSGGGVAEHEYAEAITAASATQGQPRQPQEYAAVGCGAATGAVTSDAAHGEIDERHEHGTAGDAASTRAPTGLGLVGRSIEVQITDRAQAETRLRDVGTDGGYIVRARSNEDAAAQNVALSYYAGGSIIHHKIVRQAGGVFAVDGKHGKWRGLAALLGASLARAKQKKGFAAVQPVAPVGSVRVVAFMVDAGTGSVSVHDYDYVEAEGVGRAQGSPGRAQSGGDDADYLHPDPEQPAFYEQAKSGGGVGQGKKGKGKGIKRSERKGSILDGFDDASVAGTEA